MKRFAYIASVVAVCMACSSHKESVADNSGGYDDATVTASRRLPVMGSKPAAIPKATAFRMSGDYSRNVAISIDAQGNITYYPAPSDISETSVPVFLGDGWWLNRQGLGANSVFTKYTFDEYRALGHTPSLQELKESLIPGAKVTEMVRLPYSVGEANSHINEIKDYLNIK